MSPLGVRLWNCLTDNFNYTETTNCQFWGDPISRFEICFVSLWFMVATQFFCFSAS